MVVYIACDIETDGPTPNPYSMLQLGAAAFNPEGELLSTFTCNLEELPGGKKCEKTMNWWAQQNGLYEKTRENMVSPLKAMELFDAWVRDQGAKPVFVGYPVAWDFSFVYWYLINYLDRSPFSHSALDIKTLAMVALNKDYRAVSKGSMPKEWFSEDKHSHVAVEDAIEQGRLFFKVLKAARDITPQENR